MDGDVAGLSDFWCDFEALDVGCLVDLAALLDRCADLEAAGAVDIAPAAQLLL